MRWWQVWVLAGTVLIYSALGALSEYRLAEARAERDRLLAELADFRMGNRKLHTALEAAEARARELDGAPVRGPYPDGQSSEKYDPWRPGMPQVSAFTFAVPGSGVCAVTADQPACAAGPLVRGLPSSPTTGEGGVR